MILMNIEYNVWLGHDSTTLCDSTRLETPVTRDLTRLEHWSQWLVTRLGLDPHDSWLDSGLVPSDSSTALLPSTSLNCSRSLSLIMFASILVVDTADSLLRVVTLDQFGLSSGEHIGMHLFGEVVSYGLFGNPGRSTSPSNDFYKIQLFVTMSEFLYLSHIVIN